MLILFPRNEPPRRSSVAWLSKLGAIFARATATRAPYFSSILWVQNYELSTQAKAEEFTLLDQ